MFAVMLCHAQKTARQWNSEVTAGWNLGNQFECSAPGNVLPRDKTVSLWT